MPRAKFAPLYAELLDAPGPMIVSQPRSPCAGLIAMRQRLARPLVGIVMGSDSDWATMEHAARQLVDFQIPYEASVVSAHRTPDAMFDYAATAKRRGLRCIIAGAGGSAHLPGMIASKTVLPVLGVPVSSRHLQGLDSLLSIVQMPRGIPVATFAVGEAGCRQRGIVCRCAAGRDDPALARKLTAYRRALEAKVRAMKLPPSSMRALQVLLAHGSVCLAAANWAACLPRPRSVWATKSWSSTRTKTAPLVPSPTFT